MLYFMYHFVRNINREKKQKPLSRAAAHNDEESYINTFRHVGTIVRARL